MQKNVVFSLIFAIVIALFAVLNSASVPVRLFITTVEMSQAVVILVSATIGAVIMYILNIVQILSLKKQIKKLKKDAPQPMPLQPVVNSREDLPYETASVNQPIVDDVTFAETQTEKNDY